MHISKSGRVRGMAFLVIGMLLFSSMAWASFTPQYKPTLEIAPTIEKIDIDGDFSDQGWTKASLAGNFVERSPGDMVEPDVRTEVMVTYDDENLYVGFVCYDDPSTIRATMCQRDQFHSDDAVCLLVDTYGNAAWAYELFVNPYGVQKDALWSSVGGEDNGFDVIWKAAAQVTDSGYQVEIALPFASIRFPNKDVQTWKMDFWRNRPRESYTTYSWAAYDRDEQCWPCQWGEVSGIEGVKPGKGIEILPAWVGNQSGSLTTDSEGNREFDQQDVLGEMSLGAKYAVTSDITLEAAVNPDFSQIEADAAQVDVNTTIALFYPERRPFFQEGRDVFRTLFNSFYTRTVNDPDFAVKMVGRMNGTNIGYLLAQDANSPYMIPLEEQSVVVNSGKSVVNALRVSKDLGSSSKLGVILTDRRFEHDGSGTIAAIDGDIRLSQNYSIDGQFVFSHTREPGDSALSEGLEGTFNDGAQTVALDGESYYGDAVIMRFRRSARHFNFTVNYDHTSPDYRTQTGFDPWNDYRHLNTWGRYNFWYSKGILERLSPTYWVAGKWNYHGDELTRQANVGLDANFRFAQSYLSANYGVSREVWSGVVFDDLWGAHVNFGSRFSGTLGYNVSIGVEKGIARWLLRPGVERNFSASMNIKPIDRIIIEPSFTWVYSTDDETDERLYKGYITRTRVRFQASRQLSLRLVGQYNDFSQTVDIDPLVTYRLNPFSVFYVGSSVDYGDTEFRNGNPADWRVTSRQFFMKLQYLFRT